MPVGVAVALTIVLILQAVYGFIIALSYGVARSGGFVWSWSEEGRAITKVFLIVVGVMAGVCLALFILLLVLSAIWSAVG